MLLTVIIPVYNAHRFLTECLESLFAQALLPDEIIAIDDGSTDGSFELLEEYASRHSNLQIVRQQNSGPSVARNRGLGLAKGKYVAFYDADDIADPMLYRTLVDLAERDGLDMALCNAWYYFEGREPEREMFPGEPDSPLQTGRQLLAERLSRNSLLHMVWNHLYRRDFLVKNGFRFIPDITSEDVPWTTQVLLAAKRVRYCATPLSHFRIRSQEQRNAVTRSTQRQLRMVDSTVFNLGLLNEIADKESDTHCARWIRWQACDGGLAVFHKIAAIEQNSVRRSCWRMLRRKGTYRLLWKSAVDPQQKRKILSRWIKYGWRF